MSDLVSNLREMARQYTDNQYNLYARSADRIEKLEATVAMWKGIHEGAVLAMQGHIQKLEAALRSIRDDHSFSRGDWQGDIAREVLGEKDD